VDNDGPVASQAVVLFVGGTPSEHVEALRTAGYRVEVVRTALEAVHRAPSVRPQALVVPLLLPDMTGSDLADRIGKGISPTHTLAVVILRDGGVGADDAAAVAAGASFCNLPCAPADLVEMVGRQLAARPRPDRPRAPAGN